MVLHKGFFLVILLMMRAGRCLEAAVWINYVVSDRCRYSSTLIRAFLMLVSMRSFSLRLISSCQLQTEVQPSSFCLFLFFASWRWLYKAAVQLIKLRRTVFTVSTFCWAQVAFRKEKEKKKAPPSILVLSTKTHCGCFKFLLNISDSLKYVMLHILCVSFCKSSPTSNYTSAEEQCVETQYHNWRSKIITLQLEIEPSNKFNMYIFHILARRNEYGVISVNELLCIASGLPERRTDSLFFSSYRVKHSGSETALKCWPRPQEWLNQTF